MSLPERPPQRIGWLLIVTALVVACAGCGGFAQQRAESRLARDIRRGLAYNVRVGARRTDGEDQVRISANKDLTATERAATLETARITWATFPYRFDTVRITMDFNDPVTFSRAQLEARFGPRPPALDRKTMSGDAASGLVGVVALLVGGMLCVGLVALLIVLLTRSGRNRRAPPGPGPPGYPYPGSPSPDFSPPPTPYPPPGPYPRPPGS